MPSLADIRRFNQSLVALGDEPSVVQSWGEELEEVEAPEEGLDSELTQLLGEASEDDGEIPSFDELPEPVESEPSGSFLHELTQDEAAAEESPSEDTDSADTGEAEDFEGAEDFGDLFDADAGETESAGGEEAAEEAFDLPEDTFDLSELEGESATAETADESFDVDLGGSELDEVEDATAPEDVGADTGFDPDLGEAAEPDEFGDLGDLGEAEDFGDLFDADADVETDAEADAETDAEAGEAESAGGEEAAEGAFDLPEDTFDLSELEGESATSETADESFDVDFGESELDEVEDATAPGDVGADADFDADLSEAAELDEFGDLGDFGEAEEIGESEETDEGEPQAADEEPDDLGMPEEGLSFDDESGVFDENGLDLDSEEFEGFEITDEEIPTGTEPGAGDDLSFEPPGGDEPTDDMFGGEETSAAEEDFSMGEAADVEEVGDDELDEFSLGDFGAEFGVLEEARSGSDEDLNPAINVPEVAPGVPAASAGISLTEGEFGKLQSTLGSFPLNLKLEVEQLIAEEKGDPQQIERVIRMLVAGDSAQAVAQAVGRILGKRIRIPRGYEKRSGEEFEVERGSFAYQLREHILPALRVAAIVAVGLGLLGLISYHLIYRPIHARNLYQEGLAYVDEQQYALGNETFLRARDVWEADVWFYRYAEQFGEERQYSLAQEKYAQLLFGMSEAQRQSADALLRNGEYALLVNAAEPPKQGVLDYAELESERLGNYAKADRLLRLPLVRAPQDYDAWLARGDNYMRWAERDPAKLEEARRAYGRLIQAYGDTDELLFRMLAYFIRVDNEQEVQTLADLFQDDPTAEIEPQIYADLGGYLIDKDDLEDVEAILFRTIDVDPNLADPHYHLARYYREVSEIGEERRALSNALAMLQFSEPLDGKRQSMLIDTHIRIGENQYAEDQYLDAQESFDEAIELYDTARSRDVLAADPELARAYARRGDVDYYIARDFQTALEDFGRAEALGYTSPELNYKQGFVRYREAAYNDALDEFRDVERSSPTNRNVLWALGNTHFRRGNYSAAEAYYRELLNEVEGRRDQIRTLLIEEDSEHRSVIEYMIKTRNNLGVTLYNLNTQTGDPAKFSEALVYLTDSSELAENYKRDPETGARAESANLAFVNQRELVYPREEYEPQIYSELPMDPKQLLF